MKKGMVVLVLLAAFVATGFLQSQDKAQRIDLPKRTVEENWSRLAWLSVVQFGAGISFAKTMGKTPEEFGAYIGKIFLPGWEFGKGLGPAYVVKWTYINNTSAYPGFKMEILEDIRTSVKLKMTDTIKPYFADGPLFGVTLEEYRRCMNKVMDVIADYLGLTQETKFEGDWIFYTIADKK